MFAGVEALLRLMVETTAAETATMIFSGCF
jgi:hypothetical protein